MLKRSVPLALAAALLLPAAAGARGRSISGKLPRGGYTVIVPRSAVRQVNMSTHRAMGFVVTGGMIADKGHGQPPDAPPANDKREQAGGWQVKS